MNLLLLVAPYTDTLGNVFAYVVSMIIVYGGIAFIFATIARWTIGLFRKS